MTETKTGAIVCRKQYPDSQVRYTALAFITEIPAGFSDEDLRENLDPSVIARFTDACDDILYRADVLATTNEVQEEFLKLADAGRQIPRLNFKARSGSAAV